MKRIPLILALGATLLAIAVSRVESSRPYVGLFGDATHTSMSFYAAGPFVPFTLWVWWYPGDDGLQGTTFRLSFPSNVVSAGIVQNPDCALTIGCLWPDLCCLHGNCQTDWVSSHQIGCFLLDANPSFIRVMASPPDTALVVANCLSGYPVERATILNDFGLNQSYVIAAEPVSWGAIKSLYR